MSLESVSSADGASYTFLVGENTQTPPTAARNAGALAKAHNWYDVDVTNSPISPTQIKQTFGYAIAGNPPYTTALLTFASAYSVPLAYSNNPMIANINSAHSGGAVVAYCDGHVVFARDDIGLTMATGGSGQSVYQIAVTPEGSKNGTEPPVDESQLP